MGVVGKESQSEPLGFYFVFVWSGSAFISSTSIYVDSVMDVGRGSSELPKGTKLNKSSYLNPKKR